MSDEDKKGKSKAASVITTSNNLKKFKKKLQISNQSTEQKGS
jgi:hypothetical protein